MLADVTMRDVIFFRALTNCSLIKSFVSRRGTALAPSHMIWDRLSVEAGLTPSPVSVLARLQIPQLVVRMALLSPIGVFGPSVTYGVLRHGAAQ